VVCACVRVCVCACVRVCARACDSAREGEQGSEHGRVWGLGFRVSTGGKTGTWRGGQMLQPFQPQMEHERPEKIYRSCGPNQYRPTSRHSSTLHLRRAAHSAKDRS